jgi:hypothetical protein
MKNSPSASEIAQAAGTIADRLIFQHHTGEAPTNVLACRAIRHMLMIPS